MFFLNISQEELGLFFYTKKMRIGNDKFKSWQNSNDIWVKGGVNNSNAIQKD